MDSEEALSLLALAEEAEVGLRGAESGRWMENLEVRLADLRKAADWFVAHGEPARALRLAAALTTFWREGERFGEGEEWMGSLLSAPGADVPSAARAKALHGAGVLSFERGDQEAARTRYEEALRVARAADDWRAQVLALGGLARAAVREGDVAAVREHSERALTMARDMRDRRAESGPLHMLAGAARAEGDLEGAGGLYEESLALHRDLKDHHMVAVELLNLGRVERSSGNPGRSEERFRESLSSALGTENMSVLPGCLAGLGCAAAARGDLERAARLLAAAEARLQAPGAVLDPDDRAEFERAVAAVREGLPGERVRALWEHGRALQPEDAMSLALER